MKSQGMAFPQNPRKWKLEKNGQFQPQWKKLRTFLGFASYYHRFIDSFTKIAELLQQLVNESCHELMTLQAKS